MTIHQIQTYEDESGYNYWRIVALADTPSGPNDELAPKLVADSGRSYQSRPEMLNSLFSIFFGDYDESFLTLYAEWNPDNSGHAWQQAPRASSEGMDQIPFPDTPEMAGKAPWGDSDPAL